MLTTLGERLRAGEAADLAAQLPMEIDRFLTEPRSGQQFTYDEFVDRVAEEAHVGESEAAFYAQAVVSLVCSIAHDSEVRDGLDEDELDDERERARQRAEEKLDAFRDGRPPADLEGKHVLIVDDGVATGATMRSCVRTAKDGGASRVTVPVPVAPSTRVPELEREADAVIPLRAPERFTAVGRFHQTFDQVSTEEAVEYLEASAAPR